ncbi:MAG: hypothetical protein HUJ87_08815 [Fusobacterium varium]|uniref:hypothetical protein n=1 Tax=Fusobacterium varium TaxID=856 RepID=UPI002432F4E0|nr:hypothetical protein [Fusobacterium varium]MCF0170582.1 hypothetical protein [Fusobacterium varium]
MIVIYEPWAIDEEHYIFNLSFLKVILNIYKDKEIIYLGNENQIKKLKNILNDEKIIYIRLKIAKQEKLNKIKFLYEELKNCLVLKNKIKKYDIEEIFVTTSYPQVILFTKILLYNKKINYVMHGYLEWINKKFKFWNLGFYMLPALKLLNKKKRYIVLGESIKKNLVEKISSLDSKIIVIDHPYIDLKKNKIKKNKIKKNKIKKIKIGTIGVANESKGNDFLFLLETYLEKNQIKNVELYHIGKIEKEILPKKTNVILPSKEKMLSEEEYNNYINELDYILYFYPSSSYKLTASGAIFDAIFKEKPIIAIKNDYFEYIFNKSENIGYLCKDFEELKNKVKEISSREQNNEYFYQKNELKKLKKYFNPERIAYKSKNKF